MRRRNSSCTAKEMHPAASGRSSTYSVLLDSLSPTTCSWSPHKEVGQSHGSILSRYSPSPTLTIHPIKNVERGLKWEAHIWAPFSRFVDECWGRHWVSTDAIDSTKEGMADSFQFGTESLPTSDSRHLHTCLLNVASVVWSHACSGNLSSCPEGSCHGNRQPLSYLRMVPSMSCAMAV